MVIVSQEYKRSMRSFLLEPLKQVRIGLYFIGLTFGFTALLVGLFLNVMYDQHQRTMQLLEMSDGSTFWDLFANPIVFTGLLQIGIALGLFFLVTLATSIVLTHRIYGPLISIRRHIGQLKRGAFESRVRIRRRDELHGLADDLNQLAEALQAREQQDQRAPTRLAG